MGNDSSHHKDPYSTNDFELVIRLAKELEYLLGTYFHATGNGLDRSVIDEAIYILTDRFGSDYCLIERPSDKINSATHNGQPLPKHLVHPMWRLNKERNQLVHNREYNAIKDRQTFITTFETVKKSLQDMIRPPGQSYSQSGCLIS